MSTASDNLPMTAISPELLGRAAVAFERMAFQQREKLADEVYARQPNLLALIVVLKVYGANLEQMEVVLHVLLVFFEAMKARSVGGRRNVGCKTAAAVHFLPAFCPIATAMGLQTRQKLSSLGPPFASTPSAAHTPSGLQWPVISEDDQERCLKRVTGRIRFTESLSPDLQAKATADAIADHSEQQLLAYVYGAFKERGLLGIKTEAEKMMLLAALNLVECIADTAPKFAS